MRRSNWLPTSRVITVPDPEKTGKAGYVTTYSAEHQGRKRKYYSITEAGKHRWRTCRANGSPIVTPLTTSSSGGKRMTSGNIWKQLEKYLRKLPQSDYEDAMEYFTEYFADAGPENEQAVIKELGTPETGSRRADAESSGQKSR